MMVDARIVFLDEVGAGVNRTLLRSIGDAIIKLNREKGYTFCMIEHDMEFIRRLCDPVICMAEGAVLAVGSAQEVQNNEEVIEAYLGRGLENKAGSPAPASTPINRFETKPGRASCTLSGEKMVAGYGGGDILKGCTVNVDQGEIAVIVGPNGAGKSTAMKALLGMLPLKAGSVRLNGEEISHLSVQRRIARGIAFTPQTGNVFLSMSVRENLEMGAFLRKDDLSETLRQIYRLFPALATIQEKLVGELSGGQRQQVAVGRALMSRPSALLLDEPTAGVSPIVMDELFARILEVRKSGVPVLMVEQNARQSLGIADIGFVLVVGENRHTDYGSGITGGPRSTQVVSGRVDASDCRPAQRDRIVVELRHCAGTGLRFAACARRPWNHTGIRYFALRQLRPRRYHGLRRHDYHSGNLVVAVGRHQSGAATDRIAGAAGRHTGDHGRGDDHG